MRKPWTNHVISQRSYFYFSKFLLITGESRAAATSKMERFVIIVNGWKPLTIITKRSISDVAAAIDPPLLIVSKSGANLTHLDALGSYF